MTCSNIWKLLLRDTDAFDDTQLAYTEDQVEV